MEDETKKQPITKCWGCEKELFHTDEFVVVRLAPGNIGSYCHECNHTDEDD
jgi:hypothetical protein